LGKRKMRGQTKATSPQPGTPDPATISVCKFESKLPLQEEYRPAAAIKRPALGRWKEKEELEQQ
ncbi:Hypothetical predicted protein, partial [Marmota monax]